MSLEELGTPEQHEEKKRRRAQQHIEDKRMEFLLEDPQVAETNYVVVVALPVFSERYHGEDSIRLFKRMAAEGIVSPGRMDAYLNRLAAAEELYPDAK